MRYQASYKLVLIIVGSIIGLIALLVLIAPASEKEDRGIFGQLTLKEEASTPTKHKSNYQRIKEQDQQKNNTLRYKTKKNKENPFFSLYRQEQKKQQGKEYIPKKVKPIQDKDQAFFSFSNTELAEEKQFFEAVLRETQQAQPGKPLRIFLQEPLEALQLKSGTILKGIPRLEGDRVKIDITAAIVGKQTRPIQLLCFDKEDLQEGLYHDALAAYMEQNTKAGLIDELWDIGLDQSEITQKGGRVAKKLYSANSVREKIIINSGKTLFVGLPKDDNIPLS